MFQPFSKSFRRCFEYRTFQKKKVIHDKNRTFSTRVFSCRFFSSRFSFKDLNDSTSKITVPVADLNFTGKAMHFNGLISTLMVLLIKEEMHRRNVQLL